MDLEISRLARAALLAAGLAVVPPAAAFAGPVADNAAAAEALLDDGLIDEAIAAFGAATEAFWDATPLTFGAVVFVDEVTAFRDYQARPEAAFVAGDTVTIYLEPRGYGFVSADGWYRAAFATALEIRTPGGLILGQSDDFGTIVWTGRYPSREILLTVSVTLPDLKPGDYEFELTLSDEATDKSETVVLPFAISE